MILAKEHIALQDHIILFPLFPISRYEPTVCGVLDINDEITSILIIREPVSVKVESLDETQYKNLTAWVKAMCKKYNVINLKQNDYARM